MEGRHVSSSRDERQVQPQSQPLVTCAGACDQRPRPERTPFRSQWTRPDTHRPGRMAEASVGTSVPAAQGQVRLRFYL